ncbi:MAG: 2-hydroxyacid dehydrogenase [Candidatus Nitrosocosmicus sp.]
MKKWNVYATRRIPEPAISTIAKECNVVLNNNDRPSKRSELLDGVRNKDAILCTLSDNIDREVLDSAGSTLKVISSYSTGTDHIDIKEATKRGIHVTTTGDILTEAVADLTFALILGVSRYIVQGHELITQDQWKFGWDPNLLLGSDVHGATIGIFGLGKIGAAVAKRAKGFDMEIIYYRRQGKKNIQIDNELGARHVSNMDELVENSDFLSLHCPLNSETHHLIDRSKLKRMKKDAYLINTARGSVVNEDHLIEALENQWIEGAVLDVFEKEPPLPNNPLLKMKNVLLLPHLGSPTFTTRTKMAKVAAENLLNVLNEKSPIYGANLGS